MERNKRLVGTQQTIGIDLGFCASEATLSDQKSILAEKKRLQASTGVFFGHQGLIQQPAVETINSQQQVEVILSFPPFRCHESVPKLTSDSILSIIPTDAHFLDLRQGYAVIMQELSGLQRDVASPSQNRDTDMYQHIATHQLTENANMKDTELLISQIT